MHKQVEEGGFKNLKPPKKKGSETKESGRGGAVGGGGKGGGGIGGADRRLSREETVVALGNTGYDQGMGNRGEVFMTWEGFEPGTWSLELWDLADSRIPHLFIFGIPICK